MTNPAVKAGPDPFESFKVAQREGWAHFAPLEMITTMPAARLVNYAGVKHGQRVLDVGCGTGVIAITAARQGANVTALDLTPPLLERARHNAEVAGVTIDFREGDVEQLPFADASFDVVLSQFGHMFAPRPALAIAEMLRVLKPGGTIAFSTWPPDLFTGRMFRLVSSYMPPPPPGVSPPPQWGDQNVVRERLGSAVKNIEFENASLYAPALSPQHYRLLTERTAGPLVKLVDSLTTADPQKLAKFRQEFESLVREYFNENYVRQEFLMTRAIKN
jgi:ubiquinone/menaquinone biosynthesis C-methylase UbiE